MLWMIKSHAKCSLQYCFTQKATAVHLTRSEAKLTLVPWYPACQLPCFKKIGLSKKDLKSSSAIIRGMSGADLQNCGFVEISVTCNEITVKSRFYVTKQECAFILGLGFCKEFKLVTIAPVCIQQSISLEPCHVEAVHITEESEADYDSLQKKWKKHLPLGKKTGDPLEDLKQIFPDTFEIIHILFLDESEE